jgi:hypothetical protein
MKNLEEFIKSNLSDIQVNYDNSACYPTHADWDIQINHNSGFMEWGSNYRQVSITHKVSGKRGSCTIFDGRLACIHFYN